MLPQKPPGLKDVAQPQMYTSAGMIGSDTAWLEGYTGAGSRIAVIDTGTDTDHQSFQAEAFVHALEENASQAGMSYADYIETLDLLDEEEIASLLDKLHIHEKESQADCQGPVFQRKAGPGLQLCGFQPEYHP